MSGMMVVECWSFVSCGFTIGRKEHSNDRTRGRASRRGHPGEPRCVASASIGHVPEED